MNSSKKLPGGHLGYVGMFVSCLLMLVTPSEAGAHPLVAIAISAPIMASTAIIPAASSTCAGFTYDKNGNRIAQVTTAVPTTASTWGSAKFGCFVWHT